ncbi:TatD family hydrolase [Microbulbifer thermotolerans]|uniref:TatD family hydrolase n=1 Tax=Microbulbifer thermotolerans TaxID=252514 RepID=UPI00224AE32E|nr:TatD family hydrolase [Microbulbifer thermotolerans]MCX2779613.1 TatD family hydrolase [Microbulbifer thermotolerans]MCX2804956.1 TatD family hydrolase [Microbulbifer thermotolerans]WKT59229.1 TatD family hydrolase [Microbulbifer thermotolerans]
MRLIDSHCHFDFAAFDKDRASVWRQCREAGVERIIIPGVSPPRWQALLDLVRSEPAWHAALGVHPWWVAESKCGAAQLQRDLAASLEANACVAIGECGLDGAIATPLEKQEEVFRAQLALAESLQLPLIVHARRCHNEMLHLLKAYRPSRGGVIHAFSGSVEIAREYWKLGFSLGAGGTITYDRAAKTRRAFAALPLEAIVLETDAPDMPLQGRQGQRNSPACLLRIARTLAELRGVSVETVADQTRRNTEALFSL